MFEGLKKNVEEFKERTNKYFEEHPQVKKGLVITGKVCAVAGVGFLGYKVVKNHIKANELQKQINDMRAQNLVDALKETTVNSDQLAIDDHSFDMIFVDRENGTKFIAEDSCLGSYVNDIMDVMMDTDRISFKVEEAVNDAVGEVVSDAVQEVIENAGEV